jgi:hypothetical protein
VYHVTNLSRESHDTWDTRLGFSPYTVFRLESWTVSVPDDVRVPSVWYNMAVTQVRAHLATAFPVSERRTEHLYIVLGHENVAKPVPKEIRLTSILINS